jgi:hypothetical protein
VDLQRRVGTLEGDVGAHDVEGIVAVDPDAEGLVS